MPVISNFYQVIRENTLCSGVAPSAFTFFLTVIFLRSDFLLLLFFLLNNFFFLFFCVAHISITALKSPF